MSGPKLTKAARDLLTTMGIRSNILVNGDEHSPKWWLDGGFGVKANVAESLVRRGYVRLTRHEGGQPGVLSFTVTPEGRAALNASKGE